MDPARRHLVEILRCRYAAAQCQNQLESIFSWCEALFKKITMSNFGLILEKLEIGPYPGHDLFRTLEMTSSGKMKAN